jgi:hypothetical protein
MLRTGSAWRQTSATFCCASLEEVTQATQVIIDEDDA